MAPVSLLTCEVLVGGERGAAAAVFTQDSGTKAGMAWHEPPSRPKQILTWLRGKKGSKNGAAAMFAGIGVATGVNPTTAIREMWLTSGRSRPTKGWRRWRSSRRTWGRSKARRDAVSRARGALEALGGNGDGAVADGVAKERKEESGRALGECGASWRPWRHRRPDERGQCRRTGAKWQPGVALGDHDGELGSDSDLTMTDWQSYFDRDYLPNQGQLGDGVVDKVEVLAEFYNIVN